MTLLTRALSLMPRISSNDITAMMKIDGMFTRPVAVVPSARRTVSNGDAISRGGRLRWKSSSSELR